MSDFATTATAARAILSEAGDTLSASRTQDLAFTLYNFCDPASLVAVQGLLSLSLTRTWFTTIEVEAIIVSIEAQSATLTMAG